MTARHLRIAALLTTATIVLAACGGSSATPTPTASATPAPTVTPAPTATLETTPGVTPDPTETPTASGGSIGGERGRVELAADGFAITLAEGWVSLPLDE